MKDLFDIWQISITLKNMTFVRYYLIHFHKGVCKKAPSYSRNFGILDGNRKISCGVLYTLIALKIKQQQN